MTAPRPEWTTPRPDSHHWPVPVLDASGRPRTFTVVVSPEGDVVLRNPPGESCTLPSGAIIRQLLEAVYEAGEVGIRIKAARIKAQQEKAKQEKTAERAKIRRAKREQSE